MKRILIRGGRILDPASATDATADLLIEDGKIAGLGENLEAERAEVIDVSGYWVAPGFVDMHTHLREPGQEYKEDIQSGGRAAAAGGFTSVACMANTDPVNDDPSVTKFIIDTARRNSPVRVYPVAAATKGLAGELMTEMSALRDAGAVAFSDDGRGTEDANVMRHVLEYSKMVDAVVMVHAEDECLRNDGVVNEGFVSTQLGLPANPSAAEEIRVARDIALARMTGARLHIAHVSTKRAVDYIRKAREEGLQVTGEASPHHLTLTENETLGFDTSTKMAPPLRSTEDVEACRKALVDGVLDAIATDHAPHAVYEKDVEFISAPCGILGFETAYPVVMDLVRNEELTALELMDRMSLGAVRILGVPGGSLEIGAVADVVVLDPEAIWKYDPAHGYSKSRNSPWAGREMVGQVVYTLVGGHVVFDRERGVLEQ
ncbi:MAG: dihydroorotase [bacterium]|nr:dihydroorotase [bacterium]